ncbi:MAG: helix-turn-helix transcriptional regulator [Pikeienuella sp.]
MRQDWTWPTARLIDALGTPDFPSILAAGLRDRTPFEFTVVFGYVGARRPLHLHDDFPPDRHRLHVGEYQEGPYLLDPFYLASTDGTAPGLWRLSELAPDRFYQGEYFRNYYEQTGLAEEIAYLIQVDPALTIVVSLMRTDRKFSAADFKALKAVWPVVDAACRRHWAGALADAEPPAIEESIERAFRTIGGGVLTPREREVVALTLKGHSAEAVGGILGIAPGTVRIHRRNIYAKLRISSQGELFSAFLDAIFCGSPSRSTTLFAASGSPGLDEAP